MNFTAKDAASVAKLAKSMYMQEYAIRWQPVIDAVVFTLKWDIQNKCADPEYRWSDQNYEKGAISVLVELPSYKEHKFGFSKRRKTLLKALNAGSPYNVLQVSLERRSRSEGNQIWITLDRWALKLLEDQLMADGFKFEDYYEQFKIAW